MVGGSFTNYQSADNNNEICDENDNLSISIESFELDDQDNDDNVEPNLFYDNYICNVTPRWNNITSKADALAAEFKYYINLIPNLIVLVSNQKQREDIQIWINKLSSPAYNIIQLRDKRNRYTLMLCLTIISGNISGPFIQEPPTGVLPNINELQRPIIMPFEWEQDKMWKTQLENKKKRLTCHIHIRHCPLHRKACPKDITSNTKIGEFLDQQFHYLFYIYKSYMAGLDKCKLVSVMKYIEILCNINESYCTIAKDIRNKYMIMLFEYLKNTNLTDDFENCLAYKILIYECFDLFHPNGCRIFCENDTETADILFDSMNCQ